jgi:hypothetical protein
MDDDPCIAVCILIILTVDNLAPTAWLIMICRTKLIAGERTPRRPDASALGNLNDPSLAASHCWRHVRAVIPVGLGRGTGCSFHRLVSGWGNYSVQRVPRCRNIRKLIYT